MPTLSELADGLIHWWSMDQSSGLRVDHIGDKHLTNNGATSAPGIGGKGAAAEFDASSTQYLSVTSADGDADTLSVGTGIFTINFFVRLDDIVTPQQFILGKSAAYNTGEYAVSFNPPDTFEVTWNDDVTIFTMVAPPNVGDWVMVTIYKDASVYGVLANASSIPAETGVTTQYSTYDDFRVGGYPSGLNGLTGLVEEVGFWNRRLTQDELDSLFNYYDNNGLAPSYTDIIDVEDLPSRSDFDETCTVGIECCEEYVSYSSATATDALPDCPTGVMIEFDPPSGSYVQMPAYVSMSTTSPSGTLRYTEFGLTPDETSSEYLGPVLVDSIGNQITARVFYDECPPSAEFGLQYLPPTNLGVELVFTYHCSTPDNVGLWDDFAANGEDDNYWSLVFELASNTTIDRIDVFQLDTDGLWTTGSVWSTTSPIYPYGNDYEDHDPLPLAVFESAIQVNTDYDVPSPLIALAAGTRTLELYGNPIADVAGYFRAEIHLSTGEILYTIISAEACDAGAPPAGVCAAPPQPALTPTCSGMDVEYNMAIGSEVRVFRKSASGGLGFVMVYEGTVAATPETYSDSGLADNILYTYYVSELATGCDWKDSAMNTGFSIVETSASLSVSPTSIDPGDPVTVTWSASHVATVEIISDDGAFTIGVVTSSGSQTFDPGPNLDNCWYLEATTSCGTVNVESCVTVALDVPASCTEGLNDVYTVSDVAEDGVNIFTQSTTPFAQDCTRLPGMFGGIPEWNGTLLRLQTDADCKWEVGTGNISYLGSAVPHYNITQIGIKVTLELVASTSWRLTIECRECSLCAILWQGTKLFGNRPDGLYHRTSGLYSGPATLTVI